MGKYPYEAAWLPEAVAKVASDIATNAPELFASHFPPVDDCAECPDFALCAIVGSSHRCLRRTLYHDPCPELCGGHNVTDRAQSVALEFAKTKLMVLAATGVIDTSSDCNDCEEDSICIPAKEGFQ